MELIDGKYIADTIKQEIAETVKQMIAEGKKQPHLAAILVGHDGGSETYVAHKVKACEQCGFKSTLIRYEDDITEAELLETIEKTNEKLNFYQNIEEDSGDLNIAPDTEKRQQLELDVAE